MFEAKCPKCESKFKVMETFRISLMVKYVGVFFLMIRCPNCGYEELSSEEGSKLSAGGTSGKAGGVPIGSTFASCPQLLVTTRTKSITA